MPQADGVVEQLGHPTEFNALGGEAVGGCNYHGEGTIAYCVGLCHLGTQLVSQASTRLL